MTLAMADSIVITRDGPVEQASTPEAIQ